MKIAHKLILAFGILILAMLINAYLTNVTVRKNKNIIEKYQQIYAPSAAALEQLYISINSSKLLIKNWIHFDKIAGTPEKMRLEELHSTDYAQQLSNLDKLTVYWEKDEVLALKKITTMIDSLFLMHKEIMNELNALAQYNDPMILFTQSIRVEPGGDVIKHTDKILNLLSKLVNKQKKLVEQSNIKMISEFNSLLRLIFISTILLALGALFIAVITTRSIVKPVRFIKNIILEMAKGKLPHKKISESKDEIGEMSKAVNILSDSFRKTAEFAQKVGQGDFTGVFKPLSDEDILGNALVTMNQSLLLARIEDEKRTWTNEGLAKFGEILGNSVDLKIMSKNTITFLTQVMNAWEGRIYALSTKSNNTQIELIAYTPENHPFKEKKTIEPNENILGKTIINKEFQYLTTIPEEYITGSTRKNGLRQSIIIVPLTVENEFVGVVELISAQQYENHQLNFVKRAAFRLATVVLLKRNEEILENKVAERTAEVVNQKEIIQQKNEQLTAGINYAKRIQDAMLPHMDFLKEYFAEYFVFFQPRDIVSGDFYWFKKVGKHVVVVVADCTGHGVPGGFMSMLGISLLNEITRRTEVDKANVVLEELRDEIKFSLRQSGKELEQKDGMDLAICVFDTQNNTLQYSGAYNPILLIRQNTDNKYDAIEFKPDKMPIGVHFREEKPFTNHNFNLQKNDTIYIFSDGYVDQFGGPHERKFLLKYFKETLIELQPYDMKSQREIIESIFRRWISYPKKSGGTYSQLDDILVIGLKI